MPNPGPMFGHSYQSRPPLLAGGAPGHQQVMGKERPGQARTRIRFADGSMLLVHWDGDYCVSGYTTTDVTLTVYCPNGRTLYFPWRVVDSLEHQKAAED